MLTKALLLLAFTGTGFTGIVHAPNIPATVPAPDFPLRIHFFIARGAYHNGDFEGLGRADLLVTGAAPQGMDVTFECGEPFVANRQANEAYPARWKKPNKEMEILMQEVGGNSTHKCTLKVDLKPKPYGRYTQNPPAGQSTTP